MFDKLCIKDNRNRDKPSRKCDGYCDFIQIYESPKQRLMEIRIICIILNVFTVTFDQFNAPLLSKDINY